MGIKYCKRKTGVSQRGSFWNVDLSWVELSVEVCEMLGKLVVLFGLVWLAQ